MSEENIKVAVRVRPFNGRERSRNATCIVDMTSNQTILNDPDDKGNDPRKFAFDHSYWSHDGCKDDGTGYYGPDLSHANGKKFADQQTVFDDVGVGILENAWGGYNATLFAYGQTGSGKSWSVVGYGVNRGVVPLFCDKLFQQIEEAREKSETEYEVTLSMLEIYNENVADLLIDGKKKTLKVRQNPAIGFYAEGLCEIPVGDYADIEANIDKGTRNRTVAATNMNATSSRAHTIVAIKFIQKYKNASGEETTKSSVVNLVDLAGSERADSTGATGDRLKEGAAINLSLTSLGNVISALADKSNGKNVRVPYRDSVLTKLLKNALGGNSKTIMIAAISPADINFDESLSTLRYADRAKQIKTKASVNEDPTEKLIRNLQEENERLKKLLESGGVEAVASEMAKQEADDDDEEISTEELEEMKKQWAAEYDQKMVENERRMAEMQKTFDERLQEQHKQPESGGYDAHAIETAKASTPHFSNLNMDLQLSGKIIIFLDADEIRIGRKAESCELVLQGPSIMETHAVVRRMEQAGEEDRKKWPYSIEKMDPNGRTLINGTDIESKTLLHHNDRVWLGTTQLFTFVHPTEAATRQDWPLATFEMAQEELARRSGVSQVVATDRREAFVQDEMLEMGPLIDEANAMSLQMSRGMAYAMILLPPEAVGALKGNTQIYVLARDLEKGNEWQWNKEEFVNRKCLMQEEFENGAAGGPDPFRGHTTDEILVGFARLALQPLGFHMEMVEQLDLIALGTGTTAAGKINVSVFPCSPQGKEYTEDDDKFVEKPEDLMGKEVHFKLNIPNARGLPAKVTDVFCKINIREQDDSVTKKIPGTANPDWNHSEIFTFKVDQGAIDWFNKDAIILRVYGRVDPSKAVKAANAKQELMDLLKPGAFAKGAVTSYVKEKLKFAAVTALSQAGRSKSKAQDKRVQWMEELLRTAHQHKKRQIPTYLFDGVFNAKDDESAQRCIKQLPKEVTDVRETVVVQESKTCNIM